MNKPLKESVYSYTKALCPKCKNITDARITEKNNQIFLEKLCTEDGISEVLICSDAQWYKESRLYIKPSQFPNKTKVNQFEGCPTSCGLCPEHQQHTCMPIIEITSKCNLNCPICLKNFKEPFQMTTKQFEYILHCLKEYENPPYIINLSGGEPTIHPDLEKFINLALEKGIMQTTVSTNGLPLLENKGMRKLFKETNTIAALQFDGFSKSTYESLRGENLSEQKKEIINILEIENIKYSLVSTIVKGINDHEVSDITKFFFESKALSIMFQPAVYTGNASKHFENKERITTPDIIKEIINTEYTKHKDFNPLPCSHYSCFALAYYLVLGNNKFISLKEFLGNENFINIISNRTLPGLDKEGIDIIKEKIYEFWSSSDTSNSSEAVLKRIRKVFDQLNQMNLTPKGAFELGTNSMKAVFIHEFMDADTLDLSRLIKCCNHYPQVDGKFIPMCAQNIFYQ